jgi:thymidylate kinase
MASYYYVPNSDGSVRWIWPIESSKPHFLNFYSGSSLKQKSFKVLVKAIFKLRLQAFWFKQTTDIVKRTFPNHSQWALFYGTPGPNNKKIMFIKDDSTGNSSFVKIADTEESSKLILKEKDHLRALNEQRNQLSFHIPSLLRQSSDNELVLNAISNEKSAANWGDLHSLAIHEMSRLNFNRSTVANWNGWNKINYQIAQFREDSSKKVSSTILDKLVLLKRSIDQNVTFNFHFAHGDFTPWNVFQFKNQDLSIVDWELAMEDAPKGFDFFHFHVQKGILLDRLCVANILAVIEKSAIKYGIFNDEKEVREYFKLYLLSHISYYAAIYSKQESWHQQIYWQLNVWEELLNEAITIWSDRKLFIIDLFDFLKTKNYAGIKLQSTRIEDLNEYSDLDLVVDKKDVGALKRWIKERNLVDKVLTKRYSNMHVLTIIFKDGTRLYLDLIQKFKRKNLVFLDALELLRSAKVNEFGIKEITAANTSLYVALFYGLNGSSIPDKYKNLADNLLVSKDKLEITAYKCYCEDKSAFKDLEDLVLKNPENKGFKGLSNRFSYFWDVFRSFFNRNGMIITLSGVDGAGKSTIIEELKFEMDKKYRKKVVVLRHRPSIIPILSAYKHGKTKAEEISIQNLPRQGSNNSKINSLIRFAYYYSDYFIGQFYVYLKHVIRGHIVIYDRFYFDMINDSKRSNMILHKPFVRFAYSFLLKPNYNFFLYASADTILERKRELDRSTIDRLTFDYLYLFKSLQGRKKKARYVAINNEVLDQTKQHIFKTIGQIY